MNYLRLLLISLAAITLSGCDSLEYKGDPQYILYIQDAPADYKSFAISLQSVELFDGTAWHPLTTHTEYFNLMSLTGGVMLKAAWQTLPEGTYTALRVTFNPKNINLTESKNTLPLLLLPENQVLTIETNIVLEKDRQVTSILDIQVAKSVVTTDPAQYQFVPIAKLFDLSQMGVLNFMIVDTKNLPIAKTVLVKAYIPDTQDTTYSYVNQLTARGLLRLSQGSYNLIIAPDAESKLLTDTVKNIQITANEPTTLPLIVIKANVLE